MVSHRSPHQIPTKVELRGLLFVRFGPKKPKLTTLSLSRLARKSLISLVIVLALPIAGAGGIYVN